MWIHENPRRTMLRDLQALGHKRVDEWTDDFQKTMSNRFENQLHHGFDGPLFRSLEKIPPMLCADRPQHLHPPVLQKDLPRVLLHARNPVCPRLISNPNCRNESSLPMRPTSTNESLTFWLNTADLTVIMCGFGVPSYKGTGKCSSSSVSFVILMKILMGDRGARRR